MSFSGSHKGRSQVVTRRSVQEPFSEQDCCVDLLTDQGSIDYYTVLELWFLPGKPTTREDRSLYTGISPTESKIGTRPNFVAKRHSLYLHVPPDTFRVPPCTERFIGHSDVTAKPFFTPLSRPSCKLTKTYNMCTFDNLR